MNIQNTNMPKLLIANSVLNKGKSAIPPSINLPEVLSSASFCLLKAFLRTPILGLPFQNLQNKTGIQDKNQSKYRKIQDKICQKTGKVTKIQDIFTVFVK